MSAEPKKPAPKPAPVPYRPDTYAEEGDLVEWYPGADPTFTPQAAIVTEVGMQGILKVNVVNPDLHNFVLMDGVYPMSHPRAQEFGGTGGGGWRNRPITLAIRALLLDAGLLRWDADRERLVMTRKGKDVMALTVEPKLPEKPAA